jgi:Domain of unknown function (DUF4139)
LAKVTAFGVVSVSFEFLECDRIPSFGNRAYSVKNLHDFAAPVTVLDPMPCSTKGGTVVETLRDMTTRSVRDCEKNRGVLAWNFDLDPKAEKAQKHGFKITWPEDMQLRINLN